MRRQRVTPSSIEDTGTVVDIYEKGADPATEEPYATRYRATSFVHSEGRRYVQATAPPASNLSRHDDEVELYLAAR